MDTTFSSNSDPSNKSHTCQKQIQETSPLDQSPEAGKGHDLSMTHDYTTREKERQLSERLMELEKEVCICVNIQYFCVGL